MYPTRHVAEITRNTVTVRKWITMWRPTGFFRSVLSAACSPAYRVSLGPGPFALKPKFPPPYCLCNCKCGSPTNSYRPTDGERAFDARQGAGLDASDSPKDTRNTKGRTAMHWYVCARACACIVCTRARILVRACVRICACCIPPHSAAGRRVQSGGM
jgi:hypothetical protein